MKTNPPTNTNPSPYSHLFRSTSRIGSLLFLIGLLFSGCGGGGGGTTTSTDTGATVSSVWPSQVALVEVSSSDASLIDVSWLPAIDSTTPQSKMKYQVHSSNESAYTPSSATLKTEGTGILSARLTDLQPATRYTIVLVATNTSGNSTASFPLTVRTSTFNSATIPGVKVATPTDQQIATVNSNQVTLTGDASSPQVGQYIASALGDGFLRKVTEIRQWK